MLKTIITPEDYSVAIVTLRQSGAGEIHAQGKATQVQTEKKPQQNLSKQNEHPNSNVRTSQTIRKYMGSSTSICVVLTHPRASTFGHYQR